MSLLSQKHMLGLADYSAEEIQTILDTSLQMRDILNRPVKKVPTLARRNRSQSVSGKLHPNSHKFRTCGKATFS